jgi:beta-galactosidase
MGRPSPRLSVALTTLLATLAAILVIPPSPASAATYTPPALRQRVDLNTGWKFIKTDVAGAEAPAFDDSSWSTVNTPHTWNADDGADGGNNYYRGVGWYRRHYTVPANFAGKILFLQFAGVNQIADVWVNGWYLGQHKGGYARFRFGATSALQVGQDNVIAVKVNNANNPDIPPLDADYSFAGGIYRNVSLWALDPLQIRMLDHAGPGVFLRQRNVSTASATVDVTTRLWNNNTSSRSIAVRTVVTDAGDNIVIDQTSTAQTIGANTSLDVVQTITMANPHLWNGLADPYLYKANVELINLATGQATDVVTQPLGLRSVSVDPNTGFSLNGQQLGLHGVNLHQDRAGVGWALSDSDHVQDLNLIQEIGANAIRMAHYQHDQKDYDLADQMGFVVWAEIPFLNDVSNSAAFTANTQQQLRELIRQNYNHPSIVFWGIGNEQRVDDATTNTLLDSLAGIVTAEDPDRLSTYASCCVSDTSALTGHAETSGYNKYFGWYDGTVTDLGEWADSLHSTVPARDIALSEYGAGANITQHALNPPKPSAAGQWHPEEYQALFHEGSWKQLQTRPYIWGTFVWNMFDFASDDRNEGSQPGINDKGLVTRDRAVRKDAFYWYKANWATTPTLYITSRRWTQRTNASTDIKVYSNAASVTATLNGASLGSRTSTDHLFTWPGVTLQPGENLIQVTATVDGVPQTDAVTWTLNTAPSAFSPVEAENYVAQSGTQLGPTTDTGGGQNVGYIAPGDWLAYDLYFDGTTPNTVVTRVASGATASGTIQYRLDSTTGPIIASVPVSNTGGWQNWTSATSVLSAAATGTHRVYLTFTGTGGDFVNINWLKFRVDATRTIQAESFGSQAGTQTETTADTGGGLNVGWIRPGDWLSYANVDFGSTSPASVLTRIASGTTASGTIQYRLDSATGPIIASVPVSNTGGWQNWTTAATALSGSATGMHTVFVTFTGAGGDFANINWFQFQP